MNRKWKQAPPDWSMSEGDADRERLLLDCLGFFREKPVFDRLFHGFEKKYASYGSFSGTVVLRGLSAEDIEDLEGFFLCSYHGKKSVSISAGKFEKVLLKSRFADVPAEWLLEQYAGHPLEGNREKLQREHILWVKALDTVFNEYRQSPAQLWIEQMKLYAQEKDRLPENSGAEIKDYIRECTSYIRRRCKEDGGLFDQNVRILRLGARILCSLPVFKGQNEYLAVYAANVTGNPHAFDRGARDSYYLNILIRWFEVHILDRPAHSFSCKDIFPALERQKSYLSAGILMDDISNYAMMCGVRAVKKDGTFHRGMDGFLLEGHMVQVPLNVVATWQSIQCVDNKIYIVENPSVYAGLCAQWGSERSLMCINGQPRLCSVLILDLLAAAGTEVYYGGDFDPEGLLIAQKVRRYYKGLVHMWNMSGECCGRALSGETVSEQRLAMLDRIDDEELLGAVQIIRDEKRAGYQENIWEEYM